MQILVFFLKPVHGCKYAVCLRHGTSDVYNIIIKHAFDKVPVQCEDMEHLVRTPRIRYLVVHKSKQMNYLTQEGPYDSQQVI